jgi:Protein of unknown function (DUF2800)
MSTSSNNIGSLIEVREVRAHILDQWGWIDLLHVYPKIRTADMFDLKTGRYPVEPAETNLQMRGYMVGVWDSVPSVDKIFPHIIQPRLGIASSAEFNRYDHYDLFKNQVFSIIENAKLQAGKIFNPGWEQCRFCGNKAKCKGLRDFAFQLVPKYKPEFQIPTPIHPSEITDIETLNKVLMFAKIMEKWCDSVRHHVTDLAKQGYDFANFRLVEISGAREIIRPLRALELAQEKGVTMEEFLSCCEVHMTQIDELIGEKTPKGQKARAKEAFSILLQDENAMEIRPPTFQMRARPSAIEHNKNIEK